jgi:hypothetical protein
MDIEKITLDMDYGFVGSSNVSVTLIREPSEDGIGLISGYGERMATVHSTKELCKFLTELSDGKYAWHGPSYIKKHK